MKAIVFDKKASPDKLVCRDVEKPVPTDDEVLIKIFAVSANAADYRSMKMGLIPKRRIFGADIAGRVESAGKNTRQFQPGDEVFGDLAGCGFGGFAEYATAPERFLAPKPEMISFEEAAALPMASVTALQALRDKGKVQKGQKVLIAGSGGGVGTFAVQLANYFGAEVTAVCSPANMEQTRTIGAKPSQKDLEFIAGLAAEGAVRPVIDRRYPLEKTAEAMRYLSEGHARGKVVIQIG